MSALRRLLAFVVAAAMVAGSLALRRRLDDRAPDRVLRVTCATELAATCEELDAASGQVDVQVDVQIEPAGVTAAHLESAGDPALDAWLVVAPWPDLVSDVRRRNGRSPLFVASPPPLARSPLVLAVWNERRAVLSPRCPAGQVGWRCLGQAAGPGSWAAVGGRVEWGPVKPGHGDPHQHATGLLVLAQAAAGYFDRSDLTSADLDDDGFVGWLQGLERARPPSPDAATSPLSDMLLQGPAGYDAVGTTEAEARRSLARSTRRDSLTVLYPSPVVTADVVLAGAALAGAAGGRNARARARAREGLVRLLRPALAAAGWRVEGRPDSLGPGEVPALPPSSGLPPTGVMQLLRERAREQIR